MELLQSILLAFVLSLVLGMPLWFALAEKIPRSRRKVDKENEELREQHRNDWEQMQALQKTQEEGKALYKTTCDQLREKFSKDIPKMLDRVIEGRLNNAFDSNLSIENFTTEFPSSDKTKTYTTTLTSCTCPDYIGVPPNYKKNPLPCKHMLYLAYTLGVLQLNQTETQEKYWISVQRISENAEKIKELEKQIKKLEKKRNTLQKHETKKATAKAAAKK